MLKSLRNFSSSVFCQPPPLKMSDFYHSIHGNYVDITSEHQNSKKVEKDFMERNNFFSEFIYPNLPKTRNWTSKVSYEYHWMQNISTSYPSGFVDILTFTPSLFKLDIFQKTMSSENILPYTQKYMVGFFGKPSEWKIKTCLFALENTKPVIDVYKEGVFYIKLEDYTFHFLPVHYKREEMLHQKNKILHWKRFHSFYEKNKYLFPKWAYPNFCKGEIYDAKVELGKELGEITMLYYCKDAFRRKCHQAGIYSYKDPDFIPFLQEHQSAKKYKIIQRILSAQKKSEDKWFQIEKSIAEDVDFKRLLDATKLFYIDFETDGNGMVYLTGILSNENKFVYLWGNAKVEFEEFLENHHDAIFVYYNAEKKFLKKWFGRDFDENMVQNWIDLNPILTNYCGFEGAFDYKLKSIQKAFFHHGVLTERYSEDCSDGFKSIELYNEYCQTKNQKVKQDLVHYNYLDCLFTKDIAEFIFKNYKL